MLIINYNENYQCFYLKKAINELYEIYNSLTEPEIIIKVDHYNGINYINEIKVPIIFPLYIKDYIDKLSKNKIYNYNFIGTVTEKREWINKYKNDNSIIYNSNKGRDKNTKYDIDKLYYDTLCKSKFTLTPTGVCPWSYRFFEAIVLFYTNIRKK